MFKKVLIAAAVTAAFATGAQAAVGVANGTLKATIGDNGTFAVAAGMPMLEWAGVDFIKQGTYASWFTFNAASSDAAGSFAFPGSATVGAGAYAATTWAVGDWSFSQVVLAANPDKLTVTLNITNNTKSTAAASTYTVGFDPDQDIPGFGTYDTKNTIGVAGGAASVSALGLGSNLQVTLQNDTSAKATAIYGYIDSGCCSTVFGSPAYQGDGYTSTGDQSINLIYALGDIAAGETVSIGYSYVFAAVPEPETYALMLAGLGIVGFIAKRRKLG